MSDTFLPLAQSRRSYRQFSSESLKPYQITALKEVALRSPTSRNNRPWKFWFIQDKELLATLSKSKKAGSTLLKECSLAVVIGADTEKSDVWIEDCSIAATFIQMEAEALSLGSCWVQIRLRESSQEGVSSSDFVKNALTLNSSSLEIASIIGIGAISNKRAPLPYNELTFDVIYEL